MDEYKSMRELFNSLKPAFDVKLRLINKDYDYITRTDIWNYLKIKLFFMWIQYLFGR